MTDERWTWAMPPELSGLFADVEDLQFTKDKFTKPKVDDGKHPSKHANKKCIQETNAVKRIQKWEIGIVSRK